MEKRELTVIILTVFVMSVFSFSLVYVINQKGITGGITGFAVYEQGSQSEFDLGIYNNTEYNGSAIILSRQNTSGIYTSKIFDTTADATWNNLMYVSSTPNALSLYGVDGGGEVFSSPDSITWTLTKENYGRTTDTQEMFSDSSYLYIISNSNREVWRSSDGETWAVINDSFADSGILVGETDSSDNLFVVDASGDVYISSDSGLTWTLKGDFNAEASNNAKGFGIDSSGDLYIVDGSKGVFHSSNQGQDWTTQIEDYGGTMNLNDLEIDSSGNLYILDGSDIWKSTNSGADWTKINDDFSPYSNDGMKMLIDSGNNFFIADGIGRIFNSTDGTTWIESGDMNEGAGNNPKGLTEFSQATSLSFQIKNCSQSDCSDTNFISVDLNNINLVSRYFQYNVSFTSPIAGTTPTLESIILNYDLVNSAPEITLVLPINQLYITNESLTLEFTATDIDDNLDSCWYALDNGENITLTDCANTTFSVPTEGTYTLNIYVNDTLGETSTDSISFNVDLTGIILSISEPSGTKTSRTSIPLQFSSEGNNLTCWYNVKTSIGGSIIENTTLEYCNDTTFDVSADGDYICNLFVNNTLGNSNTNSSSFTVDTSSTPVTPPSNGGNGGGGGGGSSYTTSRNATQKLNMEIKKITTIIYPGEEKTLQLSVQNKRTTTYNKCKITSSNYSEWFESTDLKNIGGGEIVEFIFLLKIPSSASDEKPVFNLECLEGIAEIPLEIILIKPNIDISFSKISLKSKTELLVKYIVGSDIDLKTNLVFSVYDSEENIIAEKVQEVELKKGEQNEKEIILDLSAPNSGLLKITVNQQNKNQILTEDSIIYDINSITGFATRNILTINSPYILIIIIIFLILAVIIIRRILKHRKD